MCWPRAAMALYEPSVGPPGLPLRGSQLCVEMSAFDQVTPSSDEKPCHASSCRFLGSFRLSSQTACQKPVTGSAESHGSDWSVGAGEPSGSTLIVSAGDQVAP